MGLWQRQKQEHFPNTRGHDEKWRRGEATEEQAVPQSAVVWGLKRGPCPQVVPFAAFIALFYRCAPVCLN